MPCVALSSQGRRKATGKILGCCGDVDVMLALQISSHPLKIEKSLRVLGSHLPEKIIRPAAEIATTGNLRWRPRLEAGGTPWFGLQYWLGSLG